MVALQKFRLAAQGLLGWQPGHAEGYGGHEMDSHLLHRVYGPWADEHPSNTAKPYLQNQKTMSIDLETQTDEDQRCAIVCSTLGSKESAK